LIAVDGFIFDENFKLGFGEDRDLWDRIRDIGYETYRTHNVRVYHVGNMSIKKIKNRKEFTEKNHEYLEEKRKIRQEKYVKQ
jgi:GT2 family glycosyltransferase